MDTIALIQSMKTLTENLARVRKDKCSDEFLITLDELIKKAINVKNHAYESPSKRRRLTDTSGSSDDVRCVSTEIEIITVDSDSDAAEDENELDVASSESNQSTVKVHPEKPPTQELHITELCGKEAVIRLKRIDATSCGSSVIHGLDRNVASPSCGGISANNGMQSGRSGQVSMIENEIISDANLKPLRHYTHENKNRKRYRDVCLLQ